MEDFQQRRVYAWEQKCIYPFDRNKVAASQAQSVVNYIWENEGLQYPPIVDLIDAKVKRWAGQACRTHIWLQPNVSTAVIVHELAHSLTMAIDDNMEGHGPKFVGMYMKLLEKYCNMNLLMLIHTAASHGIKTDLSVKPLFVNNKR